MNEPDWNTAFPKFLIGDSPDRTFVIHLHHPRFVAELIEDAEGETFRPAWIDEPVADPGRLAKLMRQAGDFYVEEIERESEPAFDEETRQAREEMESGKEKSEYPFEKGETA